MLEPVERRAFLVGRDRHGGGRDHPRDGRMNAGNQHRVPQQDRADRERPQPPDARAPHRIHRRRDDRRCGERGPIEPCGIGDRDDRDGAEIVGDRHARQEQLEARRRAAAEQREDSDRKGDIGRRRDRPAANEIAGPRDRDIDDGRQRHADGGSDQRQTTARGIAQIAFQPLALDLQPDEQEEDRHQAVIHPEVQIGRPMDRKRSGRKMEEVAIGIAPPAIGDDQRQRGRADQQQSPRRLAGEEVAQGRDLS